MAGWFKKIQIKHLLTESEEYEDVQETMNKIADVLSQHIEFSRSSLITRMRKIPRGDDVFGPCEYANKLIDEMYDVADKERIWIE